ncbi:hypothetical protein O6H91_01G117200 [Diphasiastrum complanatum]|uniref:Uncharacterized protein n=2 Tax=Diphasiastrum complanatum TaxID=34168 RepID=A0ACC2EV58_DIPCM|nr:hypothetical protein O6H91_01G117200 [Diphasiastrum complanatum]KAJ7570364.1 hypothetical protein O6H91_01G117200 [Diphasiastrum complanatum]
MDERNQKEWKSSQAIRISVDLVAAASELLHFLATVDRYPELYEGPTLERAIQRYKNCWLPLAAAYGGYAETGVTLVPPLDCAWVWHCHRLNPVQYARDCETNWGHIIHAPSVHPATTDATVCIWKKHFPNENYSPPFLLRDASTEGHCTSIPLIPGGIVQGKITYNLVEAVSRQRSFYYQRYKGFLHLIKMQNRDMTSAFFVPTYDIDVMWHAHQLSPVAYANDMKALLGKTLDHDDTDSNREEGQKLDTGFRKTRELWEHTFGFLYERAGVLYKGNAPSPVPPLEATVAQSIVTGIPVSSSIAALPYQENYLTKRQVVQVYLIIYGAKCVPTKNVSYFKVCVSALQQSRKFSLQTRKVPASPEPLWNKVLTMECELSTVGLVLGLQYKPSLLLRRKKFIGSVELTWENLLKKPGLALDEWFPLSNGLIQPKLHVGMSVTPPIAAPYLFRGRKARPIGDDLKTLRPGSTNKGLWMTRTILDHTDKEVFVIRIRNAEGGFFKLKPVSEEEVCIHVHLGGWDYKQSRWDDGKISGDSIGCAKQLAQINGRYLDLSVCRAWSLFDNSVAFSIKRDINDPNWNLRPIFELQGNLGYPVRLIPGRRLQYEVKGGTEKLEAGFVTVIRYTLDAPIGKATALFNWRSAYMEVAPEENVVLVLLLSSIIAVSIGDMLGKKCKPRAIQSRRRKTRDEGDSGWGSIAFTSEFLIGAGSSSIDQDNTTPYFLPWWDDSPDSGNSNGGACGGGVCGGGACGGASTACGGGCGGGGCGAGGCSAGGGGCGGAGGGGCGGGGGGGGGGCGGGGGGCGGS